MNFNDLMADLPKWVLGYSLKIVLAIFIVVLGFRIINSITGSVSGKIKQKSDNLALVEFMTKAANVVLKVLVCILAIDILGFETASLIAVIGSAGLAVGLSLQGSLSNLAGGILILVFKPFQVGDVIEAQGVLGSVEDIGVFATTVRTPLNRKVTIPNSPLSNGVIANYTENGFSRCDINVGVSYGTHIPTAKEVLLKVATQDSRIMENPAPAAVVLSFGDSSVDMSLRVYVKVADYWDVFFELNERVKEAFDNHQIEIPFPQRVVHVSKGEA